MNALQTILAGIRKLFEWWVTIAPWEQGIRVRCGKHTKLLHKGIHFRLPFFDRIYRQTTRLRYVDLPNQTVTLKDGKPLTISGTVGYVIEDVLKLYDTLHHANDTIMNMAMGQVAKYLQDQTVESVRTKQLEEAVTAGLDLGQYGIGGARFQVIDIANVRTIRLMQHGKWADGDRLTTSEDTSVRLP